MRREEARAVRNAVVSVALRNPNGWPVRSISVREPCGVDGFEFDEEVDAESESEEVFEEFGEGRVTTNGPG